MAITDPDPQTVAVKAAADRIASISAVSSAGVAVYAWAAPSNREPSGGGQSVYILVGSPLADALHTNTALQYRVDITVQIIHARREDLDTVSGLIMPIIGDAWQQSGNRPTYGLHRWNGASDSASWSLGEFLNNGQIQRGSLIDQDRMVAQMDFEVYIAREVTP